MATVTFGIKVEVHDDLDFGDLDDTTEKAREILHTAPAFDGIDEHVIEHQLDVLEVED